MANNRVYLVCDICGADEGTSFTDCAFYFAKYYPSSGWYTSGQGSREDGATFSEQLDTWLDMHKLPDMLGQFLRLMYEGDFDARAVAKQSMLNAMARIAPPKDSTQ